MTEKVSIFNNKSRQRLVRVPHLIDRWLVWRANRNAKNEDNEVAPEIKTVLQNEMELDIAAGFYDPQDGNANQG